MAYTKTLWVNGSTPAVNDANLNKIETGIKDAHDLIANLDLTPYAPKASPAFTGTMGLTAQQDVSGVLSSKVGTGSISGTSVTVTDAFITAATFVAVIPLGTKVGTWSVSSASGSFTITSTASESCAFKWEAIK